MWFLNNKTLRKNIKSYHTEKKIVFKDNIDTFQRHHKQKQMPENNGTVSLVAKGKIYIPVQKYILKAILQL